MWCTTASPTTRSSTAGLEHVWVDRPEDPFILSTTFRIDTPTGSSHVFSGNSDGVAIPGFSYAWGLDEFHVVGDIGGRIPFDGNKESTSSSSTTSASTTRWPSTSFPSSN